ncbi:MAG: four helix bundle protein [Patescibacteria group bacterium]|nr:four helix bundle protein [Patescibacteria group bacterium]
MKIEDLKVYTELYNTALEVYRLTLTFPRFEMFELGSQLRRSSNSAPANLAEGFGNKHTSIYTETISRGQGEIRETIHHLKMACSRNYLDENKLQYFVGKYEECSKMLYGLEKSLVQKPLNLQLKS